MLRRGWAKVPVGAGGLWIRRVLDVNPSSGDLEQPRPRKVVALIKHVSQVSLLLTLYLQHKKRPGSFF